MEIGILGLPQSGKSTLFEIMTGVHSRDVHGEPCVRGQASVPDPRFDRLVEIYQPLRAVPARVPFTDVNAAGEKAWETVRQALSGAEGLLHVVDCFSDRSISAMVKRCRQLADELILSDLVVVENRRERLLKVAKKTLKPPELLHVELMPRLQEQLEAGKPLREMPLTPEERHALSSFSFWTLRPELVVLNVAEDGFPAVEAFQAEAGLNEPVMGICCELEAEVAALPPEEQKEFLAALGLAEPAFGRVIQAAFSLLGRISYFTVGEDEVKAWVIPEGTKAPRAAAAIHKDFERGFIKAEVTAYEDFIACGSSHAKAKAAGKVRLEGKEYVVKDGDIINFRFNV